MASTKKGEPYPPLDQKHLHRLYEEGLLPERVFRTFRVETTPTARDWHLWSGTLLLVIGAALVLAGIFYFFAWNWTGMRPAFRFTLLEAGLVAAVLGSTLYGGRRPEGTLFLCIALIFTGILLVVCREEYNTGADAWELMAGWSLLVFGWVAAGRSALLWTLWLGLVHVAAILFWIQVALPAYGVSFAALSLSLATLDTLLLLLRERGWSLGLDWLQEKWPRPLLLALSLFSLCLPIIELILSRERSLIQILCIPVWLLLAGWGSFRYRRRFPDLLALGLIISSGCLLLSALVGRMLLIGRSGEGNLFIFALIVATIAAAGAFWLRMLAGDAAASKEWAHDG